MSATTNDGTTFDDFLREEGIFDKVVAEAEARVRAWQDLNQRDAVSEAFEAFEEGID